MILGVIGENTMDVAPDLALLLKNENEDTRMIAAISLMKIGKPSLSELIHV
ncbi:hypothetical protein [Niallia sp. 03133]|uniref:hypothetical protein n=1 Tax=Niallia sp. 03133 TaxID=3458060 RepID=UPI004044AE75